mmetsp:Transcript_29533/g.68106  ORF Transcript_29533/g.68106 Transcript_29533/m.68106 type:complete len:386 (+) Transcript_29533:106-1263(+)
MQKLDHQSAPQAQRNVIIESSSGTDARPRTLSGSASAADSLHNETLLQGAMQATIKIPDGLTAEGLQDLPQDINDLLTQMERMQKQQRSPQQPTPELDRLIAEAISERPELRQRLAVKTKSALLRKKLLLAVPTGGRAVGSHQLGTTHPWRRPPHNTISDHNWPTAETLGSTGLHHLPGGGDKYERHLRATAEFVQYDPLISHTPNYSIPKAERFSAADSDGKVSKSRAQKMHSATPGPADYFKSVPRGTAFVDDDCETTLFGANHIYPWKTALGRQMNPVHCDATVMPSAPKHTFPRARRPASEVPLGHGQHDGGPVKTDRGCLGPGPVYEHASSMRPREGRVYVPAMKKSRSDATLRKVRCQYVPLEPAQGMLHASDGWRGAP